MRRTTERVGGRSRNTPTMSEMKPGVIRNAPPKITRTPSMTSRWGTLPSLSVSLNRRHTARPCDRRSSAPSSESAARSTNVHQYPIASPTLRITYSSANGTSKNRTARAQRGTR